MQFGYLPNSCCTFAAVSSPTAFEYSTVPPKPQAVGCLLPVPANASVSFVMTSAFSGTRVAYANGTEVVYPEYACPQPVSDSTYATAWPGVPIRIPTNQFELALDVVTNRTFVADENGSTYLFSQYRSFQSLGQQYLHGVQGLTVDIYFFHYGNQSHHWCNNSTSRRDILGGIVAEFFAPFQEDVNGTYVPGSWAMSGPDIVVMNAALVGLENVCTRG